MVVKVSDTPSTGNPHFRDLSVKNGGFQHRGYRTPLPFRIMVRVKIKVSILPFEHPYLYFTCSWCYHCLQSVSFSIWVDTKLYLHVHAIFCPQGQKLAAKVGYFLFVFFIEHE